MEKKQRGTALANKLEGKRVKASDVDINDIDPRFKQYFKTKTKKKTTK